MADYIPAERALRRGIDTPLTLTALQTYVNGFVYFIELPTGDWLVVNEKSRDNIGPYNPHASSIAGKAGPIYGDAVLIDPKELA